MLMGECEYTYRAYVIEGIAKSYRHIYQVLELKNRYSVIEIHNPTSIIDFKVDFDTALKQLTGRLKLLVLEIMNGSTDSDLELIGFYNVYRAKNIAFGMMTRFLNGKPMRGKKILAKPTLNSKHLTSCGIINKGDV